MPRLAFRLCLLALLMVATVSTFIPRAYADAASEIQSVISDQLKAFNEDDTQRAYGHAADVIKQIFPSSQIFMEMVKTGYPPVYRAKEWSFVDPTPLENGYSQIVRLTDQQGRQWSAIYTLERDKTGEWKITGCRLLKSEGMV